MSIWEAVEDKYDSWGWKTMLSIRDMVKQNFIYKIGDGKNISIWYDKWCPEGPLSKFITKRTLYDAIMDVDTKVASMANNGQWLWPEGWEDRFNALKDVSPLSYRWIKKIELFGLQEKSSKWSFLLSRI